MKLTHTIAVITAGVLLMGNAPAQGPISSLMEERAKIATDAQAAAAFDKALDGACGKPGADIAARILAAENIASGSANETLAEIYMEDKLTPEGASKILWGKLPEAVRKKAIEHIATKKNLDMVDLKAAEGLSMDGGALAELKSREADLIGLLPKTSMHRYVMANRLFNLGMDQRVEGYMKDQEILDALGGTMPAEAYDKLRREMLARCLGAWTRTQRAAKLPTNSQKDLEEAMAPVLAALNAPLWEGLPAAVAKYGITLTTPDYSELVEGLIFGCKRLDERQIVTSNDFAGSLMFWKGAEGYKSWTQEYKEN